MDLREALAAWCNDHAYLASNTAFGYAWDDPEMPMPDRQPAYSDADELLALLRAHGIDV